MRGSAALPVLISLRRRLPDYADAADAPAAAVSMLTLFRFDILPRALLYVCRCSRCCRANMWRHAFMSRARGARLLRAERACRQRVTPDAAIRQYSAAEERGAYRRGMLRQPESGERSNRASSLLSPAHLAGRHAAEAECARAKDTRAYTARHRHAAMMLSGRPPVCVDLSMPYHERLF